MIKCTSCEAEVNYTEAILRDVNSCGLDDQEIQLDLLGDKNQDMTLEQVLQFVEAKKAGKRASHLLTPHRAERLLTPHRADALASSSYRHRRNEVLRGQPSQTKNPEARNQHELCSYCGRKGHGKSAPLRIRRRECLCQAHHLVWCCW